MIIIPIRMCQGSQKNYAKKQVMITIEVIY